MNAWRWRGTRQRRVGVLCICFSRRSGMSSAHHSAFTATASPSRSLLRPSLTLVFSLSFSFGTHPSSARRIHTAQADQPLLIFRQPLIHLYSSYLYPHPLALPEKRSPTKSLVTISIALSHKNKHKRAHTMSTLNSVLNSAFTDTLASPLSPLSPSSVRNPHHALNPPDESIYSHVKAKNNDDTRPVRAPVRLPSR